MKRPHTETLPPCGFLSKQPTAQRSPVPRGSPRPCPTPREGPCLRNKQVLFPAFSFPLIAAIFSGTEHICPFAKCLWGLPSALGAGDSGVNKRVFPALWTWQVKPPPLLWLLVSPQTTTAPTASRPTRWPGCTAIWTLYTNSGVRAESLPPFPSRPWSSGRPTRPSPSTGCLRSVGLCMTGERGSRRG